MQKKKKEDVEIQTITATAKRSRKEERRRKMARKRKKAMIIMTNMLSFHDSYDDSGEGLKISKKIIRKKTTMTMIFVRMLMVLIVVW